MKRDNKPVRSRRKRIGVQAVSSTRLSGTWWRAAATSLGESGPRIRTTSCQPVGEPRTGDDGISGEAFWEPGGEVIHYQDANNRSDIPLRFLVTMMMAPGQPMLVLVDDDELKQRRWVRRSPDG
jgi:hypothetical protein